VSTIVASVDEALNCRKLVGCEVFVALFFF